MANFVRTRADFAVGGPLEPADVNDIDLKTSRAVNGHGGGVYAPSSPILVGGAGVNFALASGIGEVASIATLKAIADGYDRRVVFVRGKGFYFFVAGDVTAVSDPWIVQPDAGVAGRWFHEHHALRNIANGLAALDAGQKLPAYTVRNAVLSNIFWEFSSGFSSTASGFVDVPGFATPPITVTAGDTLVILAHVHLSTDLGICDFELSLLDSGEKTRGLSFSNLNANDPPHSISWVYTVLNSGSITIKGKVGSNGVSNALVGISSITVQQIQP